MLCNYILRACLVLLVMGLGPRFRVLLLGLPRVHSALSDVIFCFDFDPFFFLSFPCQVSFLYLFILGGPLLTGASLYPD